MSDTTKRPLRVFLCHDSADKPAVRKLFDYLKKCGVHPWLDENELLPGQNWQEQIAEALNSSDVIVVCLSKNAVVKEGYVQKEIRFALEKAEEKPEGTIFIIPARLDDCNVPSRLRQFQWVDLFSENGPKKLVQSLNVRAARLSPNIAQALLTDEFQPKVMRSSNKIITLIGCGCLMVASLVTAITVMTAMNLSPKGWPDLFLTQTPRPTPSPEPTLTLTLAPPDKSTAEGALIAYLEAWNRGDIEEIRNSLSQYSLEFFGLTRESAVPSIQKTTLTYDIGAFQEIEGTVNTVWIPVTFTSEDIINDCCVLRKEDSEWRINAGRDFGQNNNSNYMSLVDFRTILVDESSIQTKPDNNGVTIIPGTVVRYTRKTLFVFSVNNPQDKCVHAGTDGTVAIFHFGDQKEYHQDLPLIFQRRQSSDNAWVSIPTFVETYPTAVELLDWKWASDHFGCDSTLDVRSQWSYVFNLQYVSP